MKKFEEYLKTGLVKQRKENKARVISIINEADKRLNFFKKIQITEQSASYIMENFYDAIRELIEAKMLLDGYKSYSHEATVSYLKKLGFSESETEFMNELRSIRNQTKYYGHITSPEYSKKVLEFTSKICPKLKDLIKL